MAISPCYKSAHQCLMVFFVEIRRDRLVDECVRNGQAQCFLLGLELVWQYQVCFPQKTFVLWDLILRHIAPALITHDWIKHYRKRLNVSSRLLRKYDSTRNHRLTDRRSQNLPQKKLPGFPDALNLRSLPILPTACTVSALGMYPDSRTSKLFR